MDPKHDNPFSDSRDRRAFIRHPTDIPIEIEALPGESPSRIADVSYGGLAFLTERPQTIGTLLHIRIPGTETCLDARAIVTWCQPEEDGYRVGVRFEKPEDAYRSRVLEQIFAIERFREELARAEGREIPRDEAAREWIRRHASRFPDP
ncbi:MAG: PilZ domain-containing protein [Halofilum sp. (in: g-proteobacteria)]